MGKLISLGLAGVFLMLVVIALLVPWRRWMHTVNHEKLYAAPPLPLYQGVRLTQTLKVRYPGLYRVDIMLSNQPVDNGEIVLKIRTDCNAADVLVKSTIPEAAIPPKSFQPFEFEPLNLRPGQEFCLELSTNSVTRNSNLAVGASLGDANPDGEARYETPVPRVTTSDAGWPETAAYRLYLPIVQRSQTASVEPGFDIGHRLYYTISPIDAAEILLTYMSAFKPGIFGTRWFYPLLGGIYLVILGLFLTLVWRLPRSGDSR
jgi:hypothetical protein